MLGNRLNRAENISGLEQWQKYPTQFGRGGRRLGWPLLLGSLLIVGRGLALAEAQLEVGTSTTLSPQAAPPVLPPPPLWESDQFPWIPIPNKLPICPFP